MNKNVGDGLYIVLISTHGLIRGKDLELGRDSDTGGQTLYVVELAQALGRRAEVARVDLVTRLVVDETVSTDYAQPIEKIAPKVNVVRIEAGPEGYLPKEDLWDHMDSFSDNLMNYLRDQERMPDLIHSHYADAGYVGSQVSRLSGIPLVHTGHSLGRAKRMRLIASGVARDDIETLYNMSRRIDAEETTLSTADLVIASTNNEVEEQYGQYDCYNPDHMAVVPPGTDLKRFYPPDGSESGSDPDVSIRRFLRDPDKPMIVAIARLDVRKNLSALVVAYGESKELQELGNLVVFAGTRGDSQDLDENAREMLSDLLILNDKYDLYGKSAFPKDPCDVPTMYRVAAATGGVFVNPALTEPFGLTLLEAAACGLPLVATEDGGPTDIIGNCKNGLLIDPLDTQAIAKAIGDILKDKKKWTEMRDNGLEGVSKYYRWEAHVERYLKKVMPLTGKFTKPRPSLRRATLFLDRMIVSDIDQSLVGDVEALANLSEVLRQNRKCAAFAIATGRPRDSALRMLRRHKIPMPDILISATGTEIHYAPKLIEDEWWRRYIAHQWDPRAVHRVLKECEGLEIQPKEFQSRYKISYYIDPEVAPSFTELQTRFHQAEVAANIVLSFGQYLDVVPLRASKGLAMRYVADRLDVPLNHVLVAGGSGADEDMMRGNPLGVVVANRHHEELSGLDDIESIYYAERHFAGGILEAIDHYDFYGSCSLPEAEPDSEPEAAPEAGAET